MTFVELLDKALKSRNFANKIIIDPEAALVEAGVEPTPEKINALKEASHALLSAKAMFDDKGVENI
jgi:hypothetical protein